MSSSSHKYHEQLLHWIWENKYLDYHRLHTVNDNEVIIHSPGQYNKSDGPDFTEAEVTVGNLRWYGDIEIHWRLADWQSHQHQHDTNFKNVILHVVYEDTGQTISRADGSKIPTLCLSSFIAAPLKTFINRYRAPDQLPCASQLSFISAEAFNQQLDKAHKEYFEQKVDDLLEFYDPDLIPSAAWKKMLAIALFDGLGISHNRLPMQKLGALLLTRVSQVNTAKELQNLAIRLSGIESQNRNPNFRWNRKGCRPGNQPKPRIKQATHLLWYICNQPFEQWMHKDPQILWNEMRNSIAVSPGLGRQRSKILFGTVFLPALYSLGNLFYSTQLKNKSWTLWQSHRVSLPESLIKILKNTDLPTNFYAEKLGTIYQLRNYCRPKHCQKCKVFKSVISS